MPASLDELQGEMSGVIALPIRLFWSGAEPSAARWDLSDRDRRRDLYEIVLTNGHVDDVRGLINRDALVDQWNDLYLPPWVRAAWRPLIDDASAAA